MKDGQLKKEGPLKELKREHGGFSVKLKLKSDFDEIRNSFLPVGNNINIIKQKIEDCLISKTEELEIKDEHSVSI